MKPKVDEMPLGEPKPSLERKMKSIEDSTPKVPVVTAKVAEKAPVVAPKIDKKVIAEAAKKPVKGPGSI